MRQAQNKKEKDKVAIALMLCFCVIALTSIFTIKSNVNKIKDSNTDNVPVSDRTNTDNSDVAKNPPEEQPADAAAVKVPTVDSRQNSSSDTNAKPRFIKPVNAEDAYITNPFSMDSLIYSVTLDQYMVHCGIDIEAPEDSQVLAIAPGTVTAVYNDDRYGNSIEITHNNDFITIYSNLSDAKMVEVGDIVDSGQIIGGVGSTALFESLEPAHLHMEMLKDGVYVNPQEYIRF